MARSDARFRAAGFVRPVSSGGFRAVCRSGRRPSGKSIARGSNGIIGLCRTAMGSPCFALAGLSRFGRLPKQTSNMEGERAMSLEDKLAAVREASAKRIPADRLAIMHHATEQLRGSGILDRVI